MADSPLDIRAFLANADYFVETKEGGNPDLSLPRYMYAVPKSRLGIYIVVSYRQEYFSDSAPRVELHMMKDGYYEAQSRPAETWEATQARATIEHYFNLLIDGVPPLPGVGTSAGPSTVDSDLFILQEVARKHRVKS